MIKANELRQGNKVFFTYQHKGRVYRREITVMEIMKKQCINDDNGLPLTLFYNDIEPIPLDPQWLERAGFVRHKSSNEYWTIWVLPNSWAISEAHQNHIEAGVIQGKFYWSEVFVKADTVHDIQNLYFCTTGEELTFKTKEGV